MRCCSHRDALCKSGLISLWPNMATSIGSLILSAVILLCASAAMASAQWDLGNTKSEERIYAAPKGSFSVRIPSTWRVEETDGMVTFRWNSSFLQIQLGATDKDPLLAVERLRVKVEAAANEFKESKREEISRSGVTGTMLDFTAVSPDKTDCQGRILAVAYLGTILPMVLTSPVTDFPHDAGTLGVLVESLADVNASPGGPSLEAVVKDGTKVRLSLNERLNSGKSKKGQAVGLSVLEDVKLADGRIAIAKGAIATGKVLRADRRKAFGKPGKLDFTVDSVRAVDNTDVKLRPVDDTKKRGKSNVAGVAAVTILVAPLGLLMNGRDVDIKAGTEFEVFVDGDARVRVPVGTASKPIASTPENPPKPVGENSFDKESR